MFLQARLLFLEMTGTTGNALDLLGLLDDHRLALLEFLLQLRQLSLHGLSLACPLLAAGAALADLGKQGIALAADRLHLRKLALESVDALQSHLDILLDVFDCIEGTAFLFALRRFGGRSNGGRLDRRRRLGLGHGLPAHSSKSLWEQLTQASGNKVAVERLAGISPTALPLEPVQQQFGRGSTVGGQQQRHTTQLCRRLHRAQHIAPDRVVDAQHQQGRRRAAGTILDVG